MIQKKFRIYRIDNKKDSILTVTSRKGHKCNMSGQQEYSYKGNPSAQNDNESNVSGGAGSTRKLSNMDMIHCGHPNMD